MTGKRISNRQHAICNSYCLLLIALWQLFIFPSCSNFSSNKQLIGANAPEISLPDLNGKMLSLSSLKGKPVLLHFWASWCEPCRKENPKLVSLYSKYKNVLAIYSVSLDTDKEKWLNAIANDHLDWQDHVSDLKGMNSAAAQTYHVNYIPSSFLIDKNGIIAFVNPKTEALEKALNQISKE